MIKFLTLCKQTEQKNADKANRHVFQIKRDMIELQRDIKGNEN